MTAVVGLRTDGPGDPMLGRRRRSRARLTLLAVHIGLSVGLLGDTAGFLAVAIRRAGSADGVFRATTRDLLAMFALGFGIPLSMLALITGATLALSARQHLFRYPWVIAKLGLICSVIVVGATVISPVLRPGTDPADVPLIVGATWDIVALATALGLAVFKPGHRLGSKSSAVRTPKETR
jgi:hypothetical protein